MNDAVKWNAIILCAIPVASATAQETVVPSNPRAEAVVYRPLLFDVDLTMKSGAETVVTIQQGMSQVEERYLRARWLDETGVLKKTGGVAVRFAKAAFSSGCTPVARRRGRAGASGVSAVAEAHGEIFREVRPVNTIMRVSRFIDPDWLVEAEVDAVVESQ